MLTKDLPLPSLERVADFFTVYVKKILALDCLQPQPPRLLKLPTSVTMLQY